MGSRRKKEREKKTAEKFICFSFRFTDRHSGIDHGSCGRVVPLMTEPLASPFSIQGRGILVPLSTIMYVSAWLTDDPTNS